MKLEDKFFKEFFYVYMTSIILCLFLITLLLVLFTNNYYDKRMSQNILSLNKNYSKIILNSINIIVTSYFLKFQLSLNELILYYQKMADKVLQSQEELILNNEFIKCLVNLDYDFCDDYYEETKKMSYWILDEDTDDENVSEKNDVNKQLITYSKIIKNLNVLYEMALPNIYCFIFYFEKTELYISHPVFDACEYDFIFSMNRPYYKVRGTNCFDNEGIYYTKYKLKCEIQFRNILKAKTGAFDNNYLNNENKTIFITNFFNQVDYEAETEREFFMCISFEDPITKGKAYACIDGQYNDLFVTMDDLNNKLNGYYFIPNIGFNNAFFFPKSYGTPRTLNEEIYKWNIEYKLYEKVFFYDNIKKLFSSNYNNYIGNNYIFDEIYINGKNSSDQYFIVDGQEFNFSVYPMIFENLNGKKEHVMSLIYVYDNQLILDKFNNDKFSIILKVIFGIFVFIIFGLGLLYIIYLTLNKLSKYIVIPIKNVIYMLKGINIGGKNRLDFLNYLKQKHNENIEKLESLYFYDDNKKENENNLIDNNEKNKMVNKNESIQNKKSIAEKIKNLYLFTKKFEEESDYIEKELNFYDFDDELLQYRSLEIRNLMKSLFDIKNALLFTSKDRDVEQIINYSSTEIIFQHFKNKQGAIVCQSNIGNMQSQLLKFDKAIYHLVLSLQDNNLKKLLNQNLSDELDEDDSLFNRLSNSFNANNEKEKINILVEKQMNNSRNKFSQKLIGILINTRYCRLIHAYYKFFKYIQKLRRSNDDNLSGKFVNAKIYDLNYYHKILIQFIFLSYVKNDLIKIGESILDYLQFLIKFKFKIALEDKHFYKIGYRNHPEFISKHKHKKKYFQKIINWFNLFDDYIFYVKNNTSFGNSKLIIDYYSNNLNNENLDINLENQSDFAFKINIQKSNFLKGKFCLYCKNYTDALFYFINAAKNRSIVLDGLIQKKSLKHIFKLLQKMNKKYEKFILKRLNIYTELKEKEKELNNIYKNQINIGYKNINKTFGEEIKSIKVKIIKDISKCQIKKEKDIFILIDFNIYNTKEDNLLIKSTKIDYFIEETFVILNNYLSENDRISILIYRTEYKIICPLISVFEIDNENLSKDIIDYKNSIFKINNEFGDDSNIDLNEYEENDYELNLENNNLNDDSKDDLFESSESEEKNYDVIQGLVKSINYLINYSKIKGGKTNEKYIILFTDLLNIKLNEDEEIQNILENLRSDKSANFLLLGKKVNIDFNNKNIEKLILTKYGEKSESIDFENMKKIKSILSNNKVIKEEIFYPNEIYKK